MLFRIFEVHLRELKAFYSIKRQNTLPGAKNTNKYLNQSIDPEA
jgi:hypothetical protein